MFGEVGRVAIIGGGIAGLACARALRERGIEVVVFDKGRSPGGRVASKRSLELDADLGAQYFTVRDERFDRFVESCEQAGVVRRWHGRVRAMASAGSGTLADTPHIARFVGVPGMSAVARHLGRDLDVRVGHRVDAIAAHGGVFSLFGTIGAPGVTLGPRVDSEAPPVALGDFDVVFVCLPADQASALLLSVSPSLASSAASVPFEPCVSLALVPEGDALEDMPFDGLFVGRDGDPDRIIAWVARDSSKPGRTERETWVVHAAPEWSAVHLRDPREEIERALLDALTTLRERMGVNRASVVAPRATALQRWAFARARAPLGVGALFTDDGKLGMGGDWCAGGSVESAFRSGMALAERVLR